MLAALAIDPGAVPPIQRSAEVIGELRPALVRRFGLALPVPVVLGGADSRPALWGRRRGAGAGQRNGRLLHLLNSVVASRSPNCSSPTTRT